MFDEKAETESFAKLLFPYFILAFQKGIDLGLQQGSGKTTEPERQYWTPIPAGTTQVQFRPARLITWWNERNSWIARDFAVFAR